MYSYQWKILANPIKDNSNVKIKVKLKRLSPIEYRALVPS